jgi:hypothetical protein
MKIIKNKCILIAGLFCCISLAAQNYSGGNGTENSPYLISSKTDMESLATSVNNGYSYFGKYFLLTIDLKDITTIVGITPVGTTEKFFSGIFNGDGHNVEINITDISRLNGSIGLFGTIKNAEIKNLSVSGSILLGSHATPALRGYSYAGICGRAVNSIITDCYNTTDISIYNMTDLNVGGICGLVENTMIINCYNTGNLYARAYNGCLAWSSGIYGVADKYTYI